jgi:hypothetical protein
MTVKVNAGLYYYQGVPYWFDASTSGSLSGYVPSGTQKHFVIIAVDRSDNTIAIIDGADVGDVFFSSTTVADIAEIAIADVYLSLTVMSGVSATSPSTSRLGLRSGPSGDPR